MDEPWMTSSGTRGGLLVFTPGENSGDVRTTIGGQSMWVSGISVQANQTSRITFGVQRRLSCAAVAVSGLVGLGQGTHRAHEAG